MDETTQGMQLYDRYTPTIEAGTYRYILQHTVKFHDAKGRDQAFYYRRDQEFVVRGPRYALSSEEIQTYYPPVGGRGDYGAILPHVVLRKRSLPWERKIAGTPEGTPWLALIVVSATDAPELSLRVQVGTVEECLLAESKSFFQNETGIKILLPNISLESDEDSHVKTQVIDLPIALFQAICPKGDELSYLAHLRCVDMKQKVPHDMHADGEFSVIVANRLPQAGWNTVYLVSLEGWEEALKGPISPAGRARLIVLAHWSFDWDSQGSHTFKGLVQNIQCKEMALEPQEAQASISVPLAEGYIPLAYKQANGAQTAAWYRGPFSPLRANSINATIPPFQSSDAALVLDADTGMMDVSYAAAWELGRLLALSSTVFSNALEAFSYEGGSTSNYMERIARYVTEHTDALQWADKAAQETDGNKSKALITLDFIDAVARLALLYTVPPHYLIADQKLLPEEALRFFHLDKSWIEALVDGALSPGLTRSVEDKNLSREERQKALSQLVHQYFLRLAHKKYESQETNMNWLMQKPLSGFLLRSVIVSDWPGVEVSIETDVEERTNIPEVLRLTPLGDRMLLCIVRGNIKSVTFTEPREGWIFGTSEEIKPVHYRRGLPGILDISKLAQQLAAGSPQNLGSARFALKMLLPPRKQTFVWELDHSRE